MPGENLIFIIGIDEYSNTEYQRLDNASSDAIRINKVMKERYGFREALEPVLNKEATAGNIVDKLFDLAACVAEADNLLIFYAGHGRWDSNANVGFWVPTDATSRPSSYIPNSTVQDRLAGIKAKHILLISDSCFSGSLHEKSRSAAESFDYDTLDKKNSRWIFSSGGLEKVGDGRTGEGSPFAISLIEFLENNDAPVFSAGQLFEEVTRQTADRTSKKNKLQTPQAQPIECKAHLGGQMIFRRNSATYLSGPAPVKMKFISTGPDLPEYYLPRTVNFFEEQRPATSFFLEPEKSNALLNSLVPIQKRIVLLGGAGSGKSIELKNLEKQLADAASPFVPIYQRFNTYTDEDIEKFLPLGWEKVNKSALVILLDGFDEIPPEHFAVAIRKTNRFAEKYPDIRIVISCRTNFYDLPSKQSSGTLQGFIVQVLNDISLAEIKKYVSEQLQLDGSDFIKQVYEAQYLDLVQKPFFLDILIRHYKEHSNLHGGRLKIMADALTVYRNTNKEHFRTTNAALSKAEMRMLEKVAFVMERLGRNFITTDELHKVFPSDADFENCKYLPAFNKVKEKEQWMFEHNNLQEFLAARALVNEPFNKMLEAISIESAGVKKIKPSWVNTISFLISSKEDNANLLADWLIKNDPEVLVRFEPGRISEANRIAVFKQVFHFYSDKKVWLHSNKFSSSDMARFGESGDSKAALDFLLGIINGNSGRIATLNAVMVLGEFEPDTIEQSYKEKIKQSLLQLLTLGRDYHDLHTIIGSLNHLHFHDEDTIQTILFKYSKSKNEYIRASIYKLLQHTPKPGKYVDVFMEGLDLSRIENPIEDRGSVNLMDENFFLFKGLESFKEPDALKKLFQEFSNERKAYFHYNDAKDTLSKMVDNSISAWEIDRSMYETVLIAFNRLTMIYGKETGKFFLPFFEKISGKWKAFLTEWKDASLTDYNRSECLEVLLDKNIIDQFVESYQKGELSDNDIENFHQLVLWNAKPETKNEWLEPIEKTAFTISNLTLKRPEQNDWNTINRKRLQSSFDLLFEKQKFLQAIKEVFNEIGKAMIRQQDLSDLRRKIHADGSGFTFTVAYRLLLEFTHDNAATGFDEVKNWVDAGLNFERYAIGEIYENLSGSNNNFIKVSEKQKAFIADWCSRNDGEIRLHWFFIERFGIQLRENQVLQLTTYFDYNSEQKLREPGTIEQLHAYVSVEKLKKRVIENIQQGLDILPWITNAGYALRTNIKQLYPDIIKYLEKAPEDEYKLNEILELWFDKTNDTDRLLLFINQANAWHLKWTAALRLKNSGNRRDELVAFLRKTMDDESLTLENRFMAANYLINLQDFAALQFVANYIMKNAGPAIDSSRMLSNLPDFKDSIALPLLLQLLLLSYQPGINADRFNRLESKVNDAIYQIGIQSDANLAEVKKQALAFIAANPTVSGLNFLHLQIIRMEDQLNLRKSTTCSIEEAIKEWEQFDKH